MHPYIAERSIPEPNSGCYLWLGSYSPNGYGQAYLDGRNSNGAHRVSWQLNCGPIPEGIHVCHRCDNRACVNPDHLFLGTPADNVADKIAKGRHPRGASRRSAKLTEAAVRTIRASDRGGRDLAREFGVDEASIRLVRRGELWAHVT